MAARLEIAEQARIASELAYRAEVFHTAWFAIASKAGRTEFRPAFESHAEILVMTQAAHMSALVVTLHSLFERSDRTVNLPAISKQLGGVGKDMLEKCEPIAKKVAQLRHNMFAHRSGSLTREDVFTLAAITSNDMRLLATRAMSVCRMLHAALDMPPPREAIGARAAIENLLSAVTRDSLALDQA